MNPDYILPELLEKIPIWAMVQDCYLGQHAINKKGEVYLPNPSPIDEPFEVKRQRYIDYQKRAVFYNATRHTANGMAGMVFAKYPTLDIPKELEYLKNSIDGGALSLVGQARQAFLMLLLKGRGGLLVDLHEINEKGYLPTKDSGNRPKIKLYDPENIINWRTQIINNKRVLTLLALRENYVKENGDLFKNEVGEQILVIRQDEAQVLFDIFRKENGKWTGKGWRVMKNVDSIPFSFIGANDNDETVDDAPLYDLAVVNLAHYRNSADYEEGNFIAGQPSLFITGVSNEWYQDVIKNGNPIRLGARTANLLGSGANAFLLQANANSGLYQAMTDKKELMVGLGARLIDTDSSVKTATQAGAEMAEKTSQLAHLANNLSDAYSRAFNFCAKLLGANHECVVTFNTKFNTAKMTAQERAQLIAEWQGGAITWDEYRARLVDDEIAFIEDAKQAKTQIENDNPLNGADYD
ncbi:DUF4055 domain-containing protein [Moraxella nasovis]|uniref:DUF4055 domain-containing protein n=1 Tax=Moraxella nasovis TaxID=2904121 RepID=UPI001F6119A6|nr:DUF4055 domain-containing protein [Moraxella nasovis]UNU74116.1 DUF4055 domain-containing protein [Moraxella nasovis]